MKKLVIFASLVFVLLIAGCSQYLNQDAVGGGFQDDVPSREYCLRNWQNDNRCSGTFSDMDLSNAEFMGDSAARLAIAESLANDAWKKVESAQANMENECLFGGASSAGCQKAKQDYNTAALAYTQKYSVVLNLQEEEQVTQSEGLIDVPLSPLERAQANLEAKRKAEEEAKAAADSAAKAEAQKVQDLSSDLFGDTPSGK